MQLGLDLVVVASFVCRVIFVWTLIAPAATGVEPVNVRRPAGFSRAGIVGAATNQSDRREEVLTPTPPVRDETSPSSSMSTELRDAVKFGVQLLAMYARNLKKGRYGDICRREIWCSPSVLLLFIDALLSYFHITFTCINVHNVKRQVCKNMYAVKRKSPKYYFKFQ